MNHPEGGTRKDLELEPAEEMEMEPHTEPVLDAGEPSREEGENAREQQETGELGQLKAQLAEKTREVEENYERFLRARADLENLKKRFQREKEEILAFASRALVEKLLPVIDDFQRALEAARKKRDFETLNTGVEMIEKKLLSVLEAEGVEPLEALYQPFNPQWHEPLMVEENLDFPDNTVIEEFQKGYVMKGRLIRPSLVKVSKQKASQTEE